MSSNKLPQSAFGLGMIFDSDDKDHQYIEMLHQALPHSLPLSKASKLFTPVPAGVAIIPVMAYKHCIWIPIGYSSFEEYLEGEFYQLDHTPKAEDQESAIRFYQSIGMSARAISAITSLPQGHIEHVLASFDGRTFTPLRPFNPTR